MFTVDYCMQAHVKFMQVDFQTVMKMNRNPQLHEQLISQKSGILFKMLSVMSSMHNFPLGYDTFCQSKAPSIVRKTKYFNFNEGIYYDIQGI